MCRMSWNLGASTSWNPQDLSRSVMGLLYLYLWLWISDTFVFRVVGEVRTPARGWDFLFSKNRVERLWGPPSCLFSGYRSSYPRVKRQGRDVDLWPTPSAEAKNGWSCTSAPPICVRNVDTDSAIFSFLLFFISCALTKHSFPPSPLSGCSHRLTALASILHFLHQGPFCTVRLTLQHWSGRQ